MQLRTIVSLAAGLFLLIYIVMDVPFTAGYFVLALLFTVLAAAPAREGKEQLTFVRWLYGFFAAVWLTLGILNIVG
ncbi:hypothetical protein [Alkalicoccus luteus]|uniref:Uncharacterized protein n=1 Tax=Alkalicoccus luteus TaxID=1237094 RepID=A0A969PTD0_9BACI|nr:hypothetical protein [Alkalicoccus luteus]NJP37548.1 hypothetical protein [Alkalicoccus luteus]